LKISTSIASFPFFSDFFCCLPFFPPYPIFPGTYHTYAPAQFSRFLPLFPISFSSFPEWPSCPPFFIYFCGTSPNLGVGPGSVPGSFHFFLSRTSNNLNSPMSNYVSISVPNRDLRFCFLGFPLLFIVLPPIKSVLGASPQPTSCKRLPCAHSLLLFCPSPPPFYQDSFSFSITAVIDASSQWILSSIPLSFRVSRFIPPPQFI